MNSFIKYTNALKSFDLQEYIPKQFSFDSSKLEKDFDIASLTTGLSEPVWDMLDRGGKHWRALLCLITADLFHFPLEKVVPLAHAIELIHAGSLICDDIEDSSENRRGKPCIHKIYGLDRALNSGNFLYFIPLKIIQNLQFSMETQCKIFADYSDELLNIHFGQCTDIEWSKSDYIPTQDQYLRMVMNKTSVLARLAVKFALSACSTDEKIAKALINHAEKIGTSFQIWDDIINLESEEYAKGRSYLGEDITEGKKSLIIIRALQQSNSQRLLEILLQKTKNLDLVAEALFIINKTDAIDYCKNYSENLIQQSWDQISKNLPESEAKTSLFSLSFNLINRRS